MSYAGRSFLLLAIVACISALFVGTASAESVVWNGMSVVTLGDRAYGQGAWGRYVSRWEYSAFNNPHVTVTYRARVTNTETGAVIACGSTVPVGTPLRFEFLPHETADVSWVGTGGTFDTPYGQWVAGAAKPASSMCGYRPEGHYFDTYSTRTNQNGNLTGKIYVTLAAAPPVKSMSIAAGPLSCGGTESSTSRNCTADSAGTADASFRFAATRAKFYARTLVTKSSNPFIRANSCYTSNAAMQQRIRKTADGQSIIYANTDYVVNVPAQTISCPITVIEPDPENQGPGTPNTGSGGGACVVGQSHSITMNANDPGDQVRYHIDWDADGTVDQYVPASGFVAAGTTQSASRTYSTTGSKEVRVRAEDDSGAFSAWQTLSFGCNDSATANLDVDDGDNTGDDGTDDIPFAPSANDLTLRALPSLVRSGGTTKIHWSTQNMTACTVQGSNGDSWNGLTSPVNGETSGAIDNLVTYTLSCTGTDGGTYTKQQKVNVLPSWIEI